MDNPNLIYHIPENEITDTASLLDAIKKRIIDDEKSLEHGIFLRGPNKGIEKKYGFIDKNGNLAIDYRFEWAQPFSDGLAAIKMNGKYGFINKLGEIVIDCKYGKDFRRSKFINGLLFVHGETCNPGEGYIDKKGVEFWGD